jgi:uncharacterized Zn finger protein
MDEKALERGWFYFRKGWVQKPKEVLPGFYECVITEVNPHAVSYSIEENDQVKDVFCTCGEERWCRHLSAVLYFMEELRSSEIPPSEHVI